MPTAAEDAGRATLQVWMKHPQSTLASVGLLPQQQGQDQDIMRVSLLQIHTEDHALLLEDVPEVDAAHGEEDDDDDDDPKPDMEDVIQGAQQVNNGVPCSCIMAT